VLFGIVASFLTTVARANPVEFSFTVSGDERGGFARELWAEVQTPSGPALRLPAYYAGAGRFAVRARADQAGEFRLGAITETEAGAERQVSATVIGASSVRVDRGDARPVVRVVKGPPGRFVLSDGEPYVPIGANLAWANGDPATWYPRAFAQLADAGGNWVRVWMASWGGLNLDWPAADDVWPERGQLDQNVAARWDLILGAAERNGLYVQLVLQHHGQYSSRVNPNWDTNPWNAANPGGFLQRPTEFFSSAEALRLTKQKYRYIVARWGYSPAVLAWELFNEVHWTDPVRIDHEEALVARWHDEMAAWIRSIDVYRHLVTTSSEDLRSPVYRSMDYLQPHLYATAMLAAVRRFDVPATEMDRPVFFGEVGNDHMMQSDELKSSGVELAPLVWASLMGEGPLPAQIWEGAKLLEQGRLPEWQAVTRFLTATQLANRVGLQAFSAAVEGGTRMPMSVEAAEIWQRRAPLEIEVPSDGRQPLEFGVIPRILVGNDESIRDGYPQKLTLRIDLPRETTARVRFSDGGAGGAAVRVQVDGETVAEHTWWVMDEQSDGVAIARPAELPFALTAGRHAITLENTGREDWIDFEALELGYDVSALRAVGRRGSVFVALWVWHRTGVLALEPPPATEGRVLIADLPAGKWQVTWWDTQQGCPSPPVAVEHDGGTLSLPTPPINRHAAVVLTR
jgi:hypothetical protein